MFRILDKKNNKITTKKIINYNIPYKYPIGNNYFDKNNR